MPKPTAKRVSEKKKAENPFVLNAEVGLYKPGHGTTQLGKIIEVGKQLLTVKWEDGHTEQFGKTGKSFYGKVDASGDLVAPKDDPMWGGDEDPSLIIATDSVKQSLAAKRVEKQKRDQERRAERERIESDPVHQKRQADLKRYSEILQEVSGHVENSWNKKENFRVELENIAPEKMDALLWAIANALAEK